MLKVVTLGKVEASMMSRAALVAAGAVAEAEADALADDLLLRDELEGDGA